MVKKLKKTISTFMIFLFMIVLSVNVFCVSAEFLNSDPYPVKTGKYADIRISLSELGINNKDLIRGEIKFIDSYPLRLVDETSRIKKFVIGEDNAKDFYQLIEYRVLVDSNAQTGIVFMEVEINIDGKKEVKKIDIKLEKDNAEFDIGNVKTIPERIYPDSKDVRLEIDVSNFGDSNLKNCIVEISSEAIKSAHSVSDRYSLGSLKKSETKTSEFFVDIPKDIKSGIYDLNVKLTYVEEDSLNLNREVKNLNLKLNILGKPEFDFEIVDSEVVKQGKKGDIKFSVKNIGYNKAEKVSVDLIKDSDVDISFDKYSSFVGDLEEGKNGEAYFTFIVGRNAEIKKNPVTLSVRYVFEDEVFTKTFSTYIDVSKRSKSLFESPLFLSVAAIIIIILGIVFRKKKDVIKKKVSLKLNKN